MCDMASSKKFFFLLIFFLLLSVFSGGFHHCCDYYSDTCSICAQADNQPILFLTQANAADHIQPLPVTSDLILSAEFFPDPIPSFTPLKGRAPPRHS
jgi:hypothetical protein